MITKEEYFKIMEELRDYKEILRIPEKYEDFFHENFSDDLKKVFLNFFKYKIKYKENPFLRNTAIKNYHDIKNIQREININRYLKENNYYIVVALTGHHIYIELRDKNHNIFSFFDSNIKIEKKVFLLKHEDGSYYEETLNYIDLDLNNKKNEKDRRIFFIENEKYSNNINDSKYINIYNCLNKYIYILEDIEDLEKINDINFKTLNELIDINFNEITIKEKIKIT